MLSESAFHYMNNLQYKVKTLTSRVEAFESGEIYNKMKANCKNSLSQKDAEIRKLKKQLYTLTRDNSKNIRDWTSVNEELIEECDLRIQKKDTVIGKLMDRIHSLHNKVDTLKEVIHTNNTKIEELSKALEEEKGKNQKLTAQVHRDFENSSIPSSLKRTPKKIHNGRKKTGNKPGGQFGDEGHRRKQQTPTNTIRIPTIEEYLDSSRFTPTDRIITKQVVNVEVRLIVDTYEAEEFRNRETGQRVHSPFPKGVVNEVNYGGSIKAFAFILNTHCHVSIAKTREFLSEITGGKLTISTGMINGLSKQFSKYTEEEQKETFLDLLSSPVLHADFTVANVNGKQAQVAICADSESRQVGYYARNHKGHKGVAGTPVETYQHTLVHDHDKTFYNYGSDHQECLVHTLRYVRSSMENEEHLKWNKKMYELMQEMMHYTKNEKRDKEKIDQFVERYDACIEVGKKEYKESPPTKYYMEGYNLCRRLDTYKNEHLLFLHDAKVPYDNNLVERLARVFKRKQKVMTVFRSYESLEYLCNSLGIVQGIKSKGQNVYESITEIFDTKKTS